MFARDGSKLAGSRARGEGRERCNLLVTTPKPPVAQRAGGIYILIDLLLRRLSFCFPSTTTQAPATVSGSACDEVTCAERFWKGTGSLFIAPGVLSGTPGQSGWETNKFCYDAYNNGGCSYNTPYGMASGNSGFQTCNHCLASSAQTKAFQCEFVFGFTRKTTAGTIAEPDLWEQTDNRQQPS